MWISLLLACTPDAPVVPAVQPPTAQELTTRREEQQRKATPENLIAVYKKPEGIYVDARYFGGKSYTSVRDQVTEQLGSLQDNQDLGDQGKELSFERGSLRVRDDRIYMIDVPLPEPLRRTEALAVVGFPAAVRDDTDLALEYRISNAWGFRRIRLIRAARGAEDISRVECWREDP